MKKILCVIVLAVIGCVVLAGCSSGTTVAPAWADEEVLTYTVKDTTTGETKGSMTVTNIRRPEDKELNGKTYSAADNKTIIEVTMGEVATKSVFLTEQYTVLASQKTRTEGEQVTTTSAYHSGKYYYYSVDGGEEKRIKTGSAAYADSEYIYSYIRCYELPTTPSAITIADAATGTTKTVTTTATGTKDLSVPYPAGEKMTQCTVVAISLSDTPQGSPIYAYYTPDEDDYTVRGKSINPSKKFPVKIIENNLTYELTSITVK